jgi:hypothetical protein
MRRQETPRAHAVRVTKMAELVARSIREEKECAEKAAGNPVRVRVRKMQDGKAEVGR